MMDRFRERLRAMPDAKKLAVAIYGESVASYRYAVLAEKALNDEHRRIFTAMKEEEEGHQRAIERLSRGHFPEADFVLTPEDKELVIVGTRMLEVTDEESFRRAMEFLYDTERRTGQFYELLHELMPEGELGDFLQGMATECYDHAESLTRISPPS
jgi:rubrerythrin